MFYVLASDFFLFGDDLRRQRVTVGRRRFESDTVKLNTSSHLQFLANSTNVRIIHFLN